MTILLNLISHQLGACEHGSYDEPQDAREAAAETLRSLRRRGHEIATLEPGKRWEIMDRDDAFLSSPECGILAIHIPTYDCEECGSEYHDEEAAFICCRIEMDEQGTWGY